MRRNGESSNVSHDRVSHERLRAGIAGPVSRAVLGLAAGFLMVAMPGVVRAAPEDKIFTIGNYPVEAQASDAVAAKAKAIAEGRAAALRSLVKRLVPVSSYGRLKELDGEKADTMLDGMSVRSERNSSTTYIASLDFAFQPEAVRQMLERRGIPYADRPAPQMVLVPVWNGDKTTGGQGGDAWLTAWRNVDVEHALTPAKIEPQKPTTHGDTIKALARGEAGMLRTFAGDYGGDDLMLAAVATPVPDKGQIEVMLIGRDGAGPIAWKRSYKIDNGDMAYTLELAAVVSLGVLEGRWKAITVKGVDTGPAGAPLPTGLPQGASPWETTIGGAGGSDRRPVPSGNAGGDLGSAGVVQFAIEFNGMPAWTDISRRLARVPGVEDLDVAGLSGRSARVSLRYPGGIEALAAQVPQHGLVLQRGDRGWVMRAP